MAPGPLPLTAPQPRPVGSEADALKEVTLTGPVLEVEIARVRFVSWLLRVLSWGERVREGYPSCIEEWEKMTGMTLVVALREFPAGS